MSEEVIATKYRHNADMSRAAVSGMGFVLFLVLAVLEFTRGGGWHLALGIGGSVAAAVFAAVGAVYALAARRIAKLPEELIMLSGEELSVWEGTGYTRFPLSELASAESVSPQTGRGRAAGVVANRPRMWYPCTQKNTMRLGGHRLSGTQNAPCGRDLHSRGRGRFLLFGAQLPKNSRISSAQWPLQTIWWLAMGWPVK